MPKSDQYSLHKRNIESHALAAQLKKRFHSDDIIDMLKKEYSARYPDLDEAYIHFFIEDISYLLIFSCEQILYYGCSDQSLYVVYINTQYILKEALTDEQKEKNSLFTYSDIYSVREYKEGIAKSINWRIDSRSFSLTRNNLDPLDDIEPYIPFFNEFINERAELYLNFVYNRLPEAAKDLIAKKVNLNTEEEALPEEPEQLQNKKPTKKISFNEDIQILTFKRTGGKRKFGRWKIKENTEPVSNNNNIEEPPPLKKPKNL